MYSKSEILEKIFYNIKVNNVVVAYEEFSFNPFVAFDL